MVMSKQKESFREIVSKCSKKAANEANSKDVKGDPATHITAYVDGRTGFVQDFKEYGDEKDQGRYEIGPVSLRNGSNGYTINISGLNGTNIQNHNKKRTLYERFEDHMQSEGWNMNLDISQYAR